MTKHKSYSKICTVDDVNNMLQKTSSIECNDFEYGM
jgi:hypothetical protein